MSKQQRGAATVDQLLTAALRVYAESGQQGFTVQAVTAASGVSLGSLYHHFGSFDGLAAALYIRCMGGLFDAMTEAVTRCRTARTGVRALVKAYLEFTRDHRDAALFLHASAYSGYLAGHATEISTAKEAQLGPLMAWMGARMTKGEIRPIPAAVVEVMVMGPTAETAKRWLASTYEMDLDQAVKHLPEAIWRSLQP
ncbi:TetR/AcrR family transcriptional regulator [Streptomyces sp. NPDC029216]|uniref:TetR/AcrR family transcriptional regulator n=1 Tax=Streptomyces sp. NPDC029216 TaxID=3154701 RepID=UPI0033F82733